jgi:proline-rich tail region repeat protein
VENAPKKTNNFRRNFATETNLSPGSQSSKTPTMSNISKRSFTNNLLRCGRNASIDESKTKDPEIRSSFLSPEKPDIQSLTSTSIELHIATTGRAGMKALEGLPKASTDSSEENLKLDGSMELQIKEDPPSPPEKDSIVEVPGRTHEENVSSSRHENNHQKRSASTTLNFTRELAGGPEMIQTSEKLKRNVSDTNVENVQDIPNRDLFDSDSTALPSSSSDSSGLSSLEVEQRIAAVDLADKLRRRAATLKRRRKIREKQRLFRANQSHATSATL